jgi:hypothetical protein
MEKTKHPLTATNLIGQVLLYGAFALFVGVFSRWPTYEALAPDRALIKLSFSHHGKPIADCHQTSAADLAKLPPNMRAPIKCPRQRSPVTVEIDVDGVTSFRHVAIPSGLSRDGASAVYQRMEVAAGSHQIAVRMNDDARKSGFTHVREAAVMLKPAQILVIDFDPEKEGITFK